ALAVRLAREERLSPPGRRLVEAVLGRLGGDEGKLIEMQRRQLGRDLVGVVANVPIAGLGGDGELFRILEPRIKERAFAVHLRIGNVRVPMRNRPPAGPGVIVHARQTKSRWQQSSGRLTIGAHGLAIVRQLRVKLAWSPTVE